MKEWVVGTNDAGLRLDKFITKAVPRLPQALLYKSIRKKNIKVDGRRAQPDTRLREGSVVSAYIADEFLEPAAPAYDFLDASRSLDVIYEDENILLADKKQGLLCHPDGKEYRDTLIGRIQRYLYEKGEYDPLAQNSFRPALANRIDRNTGGIVLAAKNAQALRVLCEKIKRRQIDKWYLAVTLGAPDKKEAVLCSYLKKDEAKNQVSILQNKAEGARTIRTGYRVLLTRGRLALLEVELLTGRTHQIRAHLASIGHPLLGDGKYGKNADAKRMGFKHQALYAYRLRFHIPEPDSPLSYLDGREFRVRSVWFAQELFDYTPE